MPAQINKSWRSKWTKHLQALSQQNQQNQHRQHGDAMRQDMRACFLKLVALQEGSSIVSNRFLQFLKQLKVTDDELKNLGKQPAVDQAFAFVYVFYLNKLNLHKDARTLHKVGKLARHLSNNELT